MANNEHVEKLTKDVDAWNKWRSENPNIEPDFRKADLRGGKFLLLSRISKIP
jgi:hypothetical protein